MSKYLRISSYIRKPFLIYDFGNRSHLNFLFFIYEENFTFFLISVPWSSTSWRSSKLINSVIYILETGLGYRGMYECAHVWMYVVKGNKFIRLVQRHQALKNPIFRELVWRLSVQSCQATAPPIFIEWQPCTVPDTDRQPNLAWPLSLLSFLVSKEETRKKGNVSNMGEHR